MQSITFTSDAAMELSKVLCGIDFDRVFVLLDETTQRLCMDRLQGCDAIKVAKTIVIGAIDV